MVEIFSTNRGVREFYSTFKNQDTKLPKSITIADFESRAIIIKDRVFIDEDSRFLLLHEASNFKNFEKLQFDKNFLIFLNHSKYLFNFFEEIANENISIDEIKGHDFYDEFNEHLNILAFLLQEYKKLLKKYGYIDKLAIQELYELNEDYIKSLKEIHLRIDGLPSSFEIELLMKCSQIIPVSLSFELNEYNRKLKKIFEKLGFDLKEDFKYRLDLSNKKILKQENILNKKSLKANIKIFNTRLSQIGFIFSSIAEFIEEGMNPEDIVVVLPDESFANVLKKFDKFNNLNCAMGFSLKNSNLYKIIDAIILHKTDSKDEEKLRIKRYKIPSELLLRVDEIWSKKIHTDEALLVINEIFSLSSSEREDKKFKEIIFRFSNFLSKIKLDKLEQILKLFLNRLSSQSEDDVSGGNITVLGLLETRGCSFKGVIVPDFNDSFVPKINNKDLFLNTNIRKNLSLPTLRDRENLQRYYYYKLFSSAEHLSISSLKNEQEMPSRFLDELGFKYEDLQSHNSYHVNVFKENLNQNALVQEVKNTSYNLDDFPLSATKFKTLLTCKRKFYYQYIEKLKSPQNEATDKNAKMGLILHDALNLVLDDETLLSDASKFYRLLKEKLHKETYTTLDKYSIDVWLEYLKNFAENEQKRYMQGYRIYKREISLNLNYCGFNLNGKIDRIDKRDGKLYVIDYKSGNTKNLIKKNLDSDDNFQLEFYYLLSSSLGEVDGAFYYDLKNGKLLKEDFLNQKLDILKNLLNEQKAPITTFDLTEKIANCLYCPYNKLCLRQN